MAKNEVVRIGDRIQLISSDDSWTKVKTGDKGTVFKIDEEQELIWIKWDNGEELALIDGIDKYKIIKKGG